MARWADLCQWLSELLSCWASPGLAYIYRWTICRYFWKNFSILRPEAKQPSWMCYKSGRGVVTVTDVFEVVKIMLAEFLRSTSVSMIAILALLIMRSGDSTLKHHLLSTTSFPWSWKQLCVSLFFCLLSQLFFSPCLSVSSVN